MNEQAHNVDVLEPPAPGQRPGLAAPTTPRPAPQESKPTRVLSRLGQAVPTVLSLLAVVAVIAIGKHTRWSLPKFSTLTGQAQTEKDDWCAEHGVPESICVECDKGSLPRGKT